VPQHPISPTLSNTIAGCADAERLDIRADTNRRGASCHLALNRFISSLFYAPPAPTLHAPGTNVIVNSSTVLGPEIQTQVKMQLTSEVSTHPAVASTGLMPQPFHLLRRGPGCDTLCLLLRIRL
jgi:hypothetical protein